MKRRSKYEIVAEAVRVQYHEKTHRVFLVFEIVDENFKKSILNDWTQDIELEILKNKKLIRFKDGD